MKKCILDWTALDLTKFYLEALVLVALVLTAFGLAAVLAGCNSDVFVNPPPTLTGEYRGVYIYKEGDQVPMEQYITWRFSQNSYSMELDEDVEQGRLFCDALGTYELESGVRLNETNPNPGPDICNPDQNPKGFFQLDQSTDTLKMIQFDSGKNVLKTIKLLRN